MTVDVQDAIAPLAEERNALAERVAAPPFGGPGRFGARRPAFAAGAPVVVARPGLERIASVVRTFSAS